MQLYLAELYQISKPNIGKHVQAVIADGELTESVVVNYKPSTTADCKDYLTNQ